MPATRKLLCRRSLPQRERLRPDHITSGSLAGRIREMTVNDAPQACALSDSEGWGFDVADFARILDLWPGGSFVCEEGDRIIGMLTTATHGTSGWVGNVLVDAPFRSSGLGSALVSRALQHLEARKVESIQLYSYEGLEGFYRRFGFRELDSYISYRGRIRTRTKRIAVERMSDEDLAEVRGLDASSFGDDRSKLLERIRLEFPATSLVHFLDGRLTGYVMATVSEALCNVGPGVALRSGSAHLLLSSLGVLLEGKGCFLVAPSQGGLRLAREFGLTPGFRVTRMVRGREPGGRPDQVFAIGALEKG